MIIVMGATALLTYLIGSIPAGFLAGKLRGVDLREAGSGNIGATNALRVLGKKWGYAVFFFDFLKGFFAVRAGMEVGVLWPEFEIYFGLLAAVCVVLGHNFPVWLGFRGGKGIATSGGLMLGLFPPWVFLAGLVAWVVAFFTTRYVSVASLASAFSFPISSGVLWAWGRCHPALVVAGTILCVLAVVRHIPNIRRLMAGTEKKFESKKKDSQPGEPSA
jgi:acyl phosphate:glycerol-3-phosphate acyltransferase